MASRRLQAVHEACSCSICCEPFTAEGAGKPIALPCLGAHSFCTQVRTICRVACTRAFNIYAGAALAHACRHAHMWNHVFARG